MVDDCFSGDAYAFNHFLGNNCGSLLIHNLNLIYAYKEDH